MSQDEFRSKLINLGLPAMSDPAAPDAGMLATAAVQRNRSRIRRLAALTIGLWLITFLIVPALWMPFAAKMKADSKMLSAIAPGQATPITTDAIAQVLRDALHHIAMVSGFILGIMTLASLLAAISTVWLVLAVRRVTLEQVSMGLAQISEQLKRLESSGGR